MPAAPHRRGNPAEVRDAMIEIRPFDRLGKANHGWLDTSYHFSFSGYHDPDRMGWGRLRVWNDDLSFHSLRSFSWGVLLY